ncbi:hypothetical protein RvY_07920-2 [Ramazzottius varieornatus]|uniref:Uncharacterized protein n=1 Tax=Ramazzottius varieornatus TaxID=947166 RepID=A0A1D1V3Z2_RAMVA|nr:hypothetical protein RvY_07920-2 [Ramazzottius varieornatus]
MQRQLPVSRMSFPTTILCWLLLTVLVAQGTNYGYGPAYGQQAMDMIHFRDGCNFLCTVSPASQKCFRCKNRIPMRFGKRSSSSSTDTVVLHASRYRCPQQETR